MSTLQRSRSTASISVLDAFVLDHSLSPTQVVERSRLCSAAPRWRRFCAKSFSIPFHSIIFPLPFRWDSSHLYRLALRPLGGWVLLSTATVSRNVWSEVFTFDLSFSFRAHPPGSPCFSCSVFYCGGDCAHLSTTSRGSMRSSRPQRRRRTNANTRTPASKSN